MPRVLLADPSLWDSIPAGLQASGDVLSLDNLVVSDLFEDASLDPALWGTYLVQGSGSASITEAGGKVSVITTADSSVAMFYYKQILSPRASNKWRVRFKVSSPNFFIMALALLQEAGTPTPGGTNAKSVSALEIDSTGQISASVWLQNTLRYYWNGIWQTAWSGVDGVSADEQRVVEYENDGTSLFMRIYNADCSECLFSRSAAWSVLKDESDNLYVYLGDPYTTIQHGQLDVHEFFHYGPYPTGLAASMGPINVGAVIEHIPIIENTEAGASITWRYDRDGAGFVTPGTGTLAELKAEAEGVYFNTLDLEATFTSDGKAGASFDINGGVLAGYGATYSMPLEIIERPGLEVVEV